ncbi:uncharacterized protein LOC126315274 [Schistocerca gregaria]|uniref:uncharacterized protein LOC126315274 n=1 Tax=Schistocerca gregaria TaxID=7010 RepID=UPI00211DE346|nr:uncharacterized protein LOC126315274 [Schistocerca gregaria]
MCWGRSAKELLEDYFNDNSILKLGFVLKEPREVLNLNQTQLKNFELDGLLSTDIELDSPQNELLVLRSNTGRAFLSFESNFNRNIRAFCRFFGDTGNHAVYDINIGKEDLCGKNWQAGASLNMAGIGTSLAYLSYSQYLNKLALGFQGSIVLEADRPFLTSVWAIYRPLLPVSLGVKLSMSGIHRNSIKPSFFLNMRYPHRSSAEYVHRIPHYEINVQLIDGFSSFAFSCYQNFVIRRKVYNILEAYNITHITNYIAIGAEIALSNNCLDFGAAASWQLNKNHLFKAKVTQQLAQFCWVLKSWSNPRVIFSTTTGYCFLHNVPKVGFGLIVEAASGQADFEGASPNYEDMDLVIYQGEEAPEVTKKYELK